MKKFTKKDLIKKLGMSEEKANLIMKAQNEFPELLTETNTKDFIIDGEKLCRQLEIGSNFNDWLLRTTKGKEGKLIKYRCVENTDFICISEKSEKPKGGRPKNIIKLNLHTAKMIAMRQNNEKGDLICDYFIYLEEAIKDINNWIVVREPQKKGYKEMCSAIDKNYKKTHNGKGANKFIYSNNADMINLCLFGYKSKIIKQILEIEYNDSLRDNLVSEANKCLYELQLLNQSLLLSNIDFATRKMIIENTCKEKYMDLRIKVVSEFSKELKEFK